MKIEKFEISGLMLLIILGIIAYFTKTLMDTAFKFTYALELLSDGGGE
jgi:hypothetical protein